MVTRPDPPSVAVAPAMTTGTRLAGAPRITLAVFGGYGLAALATAAMAIVLPMERVDAVTTATMASFAVCAAAALRAFAARRLATAAVGFLLPILALGGLVWALHGTSG